MEGMGWVTTSSPVSSTTDLPLSSNASTAAPNARHWSSPARTGNSGQPATNALATSVPPLTDASHRSDLTEVYTHWKPPAGRGEPVEPMEMRLSRLWFLAGSRPALRQFMTYAALVPNSFTFAFSARPQRVSRSG